MTTATLPTTTTLGAVHLTAADLDRQIDFYTTRLGLRVLAREDALARLGAGARELLVLHGDASARRVPGTTGLFHLAVLVPSRAELGRALAHFALTRTPISGASEHGVSEAVYLSDPEGNGIEIYRDRPRAEWPLENGQLAMVTERMDMAGVLAARDEADPTPFSLVEGTVIGHVHLHVSRLEPSEQFYRDVIGLDLVQRWGGSALFMSAGGYHHHLGLNTWNGVGAPPQPAGAVGLHHFEVRLPDAAALADVRARAAAAGVESLATPEGERLTDPSGNALVFVVDPAAAR